jgi:hypothetical protein
MGLYGTPTKLVKSITDREYTIEPQRFQFIPFWKTDDTVSLSDGDNITDIEFPTGAKIVSHHVKQVLTPETVEPQEIYMSLIKLSFFDWLSPAICGQNIQITSGGTLSNEASQSNNLDFYTNYSERSLNEPTGDQTLDVDTIRNDDYLPHFLRLKSSYVFDQNPLMGSRYMAVPKKCKRINPYTWYGLMIYNDSDRGATPSDTQIKYRIKQTLKAYVM